LGINLFSLFTNILVYVCLNHGLKSQKIPPHGIEKKWEELKDRFRLENLNIEGGII